MTTTGLVHTGLWAVTVLGVLMLSNDGWAACTSIRPTENGATYFYGDAEAQHFDTEHFRIWFTTEGEHALTRDGGSVADTVNLASDVAERAFDLYADLGFRAPVDDTESADCSIDGGDARIDVYFANFSGADGHAGIDECVDVQCAGFLVVDHAFAAYPSFSQGVTTVLPHELFHLVQMAYRYPLADFWSEGTAQWAANRVNPELRDMENYFETYLQNVDRPIDLPPATAAQPFSYSAALFVQFLDEAYGDSSIRGVFERFAAGVPSELEALNLELEPRNASLADAFTLFSIWNTATGSRAGSAGYAEASTYPVLPIANILDVGANVMGSTSGLSANYFRIDSLEALDLQVTADDTRTKVSFVPTVSQVADISRAVGLPGTVNGPGILVVTGTTADRRDAVYTIQTAIADTPGEPDASDSETTAEDTDSKRDDDPPESGRRLASESCRVAHRSFGVERGLCVLLAALVLVTRRCKVATIVG